MTKQDTIAEQTTTKISQDVLETIDVIRQVLKDYHGRFVSKNEALKWMCHTSIDPARKLIEELSQRDSYHEHIAAPIDLNWVKAQIYPLRKEEDEKIFLLHKEYERKATLVWNEYNKKVERIQEENRRKEELERKKLKDTKKLT